MPARECIIPVFVPHLGCPNDCVFCNQRRISGSVSPATEADIVNAIETSIKIQPEAQNRQLAFYGGSFTAINQEYMCRLLKCAYSYIQKGVISSIRLSTRPDAIDDHILSVLKDYGVGTIEIGAQSLDDEVLSLSRRGHTAADVVNASQLIQKAGFRLILQMMTGLPGDSEEKALSTAKKIISLKPNGVRIYPTVIVRDTCLFDMWLEGMYTEHTIEDAVGICSLLVPMFTEAGIPIIRLGLNPTDDLSDGDAVGGAYHPALGEMVKSRILLNKAKALLSETAPGSTVTLAVPGKILSQMIGQHRCNVTALIEFGQFSDVRIIAEKDTDRDISIVSIETADT